MATNTPGANGILDNVVLGTIHMHIKRGVSPVMKQCALDLPEKVDLEILEVKCLNNFDVDPNPRTKCWKLTVPYRFRELMSRDDLYYCGWSHRQFYPPRQNKAKRHQPDPVEQHLHGAAGGQQPSMVGA